LLARVWAFPVTVFGLALWLLFRPKYLGRNAGAYDLLVQPGWLYRFMDSHKIGAFTWGECIFYKNQTNFDSIRLKIHERRHVTQILRFGIFQPILYVMFSGIAWVMGMRPYYDNWFEMDARIWTGEQLNVHSYTTPWTHLRNRMP
jgi:hypothetical protein